MNEIYVPSVNFANVWFIFRDTGVEVRVILIDELIIPSHILSYQERRWFQDNVVQKKYLSIESKMNESNTNF